MERTSLFEADLTEERLPTPAQRADVAQTLALDPDEEEDEDDDDDDDLED